MHRALSIWLSANPLRALLLAVAVCWMPPGTVLASGIMVLITLSHGPRWGSQVAFASVISLGAMVLITERSLAVAAIVTCVMFIAPYGLAVAFERTGSLRLCFQLTVLCGGLGVAATHLVMEDPVAAWQVSAGRVLREMTAQLDDASTVARDEFVARVVAGTNWGTVALYLVLAVLGLLFLGAWWQSLARSPGAFGAEFRRLSLGKILGRAIAALVAAGLALVLLGSDAPLIEALLPVALGALVLQGLSVLHRMKADRRLSRGWLIAMYVAPLVPPVAPIAVFVVAGFGMSDLVREKRADEPG